MTKHCTNCKEVLSWKAAQLSANNWPCSHCDKQHSLLETVLGPSDLAYKDKITTAKGIEVQQQAPLVISVSPAAKRSGWMFLFLGLLLPWFAYTMGKSIRLQAEMAVPAWLWLFFGALALIGFWLLSQAVQRLFVFHKITIEQGQLAVTHSLLQFIDYRKINLPIAHISQLYTAGESDYEVEASNVELPTQVSFQLLAQLQTGEAKLLVSGLRDYQAGFFIERTLEKALGLKDERVAGEFIPFFDLLPKVFKVGNRIRRGLKILSFFSD